MMVERQDVGELVIVFNKDPAFLVGSYDESNFGGEGPVPPNRIFEVYPDDFASIPDTVLFSPRDWETRNQMAKAMFGAATCSKGPLLLMELNPKGHLNKKGKQAKGVDSAFLIKSKVFPKIHAALKRLCGPGQTPFLILERAPCHTSNATTLELNRVFGEDGWMFQAAKMPDANDGDVGVFPFMKRKVGELGGATTRDEIVTVVKRAWEKVTPKVCARIRKRVLRNCSWVALNCGKNYYDVSMTKRDLGL